MTRLNVAQVKDLGNQGGMSFSGGAITANGTLNVEHIVINGNVTGSSGYIIPSQSGQGGKFLYTNGSTISWQQGGGNLGLPNSISVYNSNSTWNKPSGVKRIWVKCTGGGGGGGTNYSQRGGNGGTSSFGNYCSSGGGQGANRRQQHEGCTGGNPSQGSVRIYGGSGQGHRNPPGLGHGGGSFWGGASPTSHRQQQWAQRHRAHAAYGAGGSSARNRERGGDGRQGIIVVYEFI